MNASDREVFHQDLESTLKNLARRHGLDFASVRGAVSEQGFVGVNALFHTDNAQRGFEALYAAHAKALGLASEWLHSVVVMPDSGRELKLVGLDPDGGEACVRLMDHQKTAYNLTPAEVASLITQS